MCVCLMFLLHHPHIPFSVPYHTYTHILSINTNNTHYLCTISMQDLLMAYEVGPQDACRMAYEVGPQDACRIEGHPTYPSPNSSLQAEREAQTHTQTHQGGHHSPTGRNSPSTPIPTHTERDSEKGEIKLKGEETLEGPLAYQRLSQQGVSALPEVTKRLRAIKKTLVAIDAINALQTDTRTDTKVGTSSTSAGDQEGCILSQEQREKLSRKPALLREQERFGKCIACYLKET